MTEADADPGAPVVAAGSQPSSARRAWTVLLLSVIVTAVAVPIERSRSSTHTHVSVVTAAPTGPPLRACDVGFGQCTVGAVRSGTVRAVSRHFVGATMLDSYALYDGTDVTTENVEARTPSSVRVSVQSHCDGGVASVPDRTYGDAGAVGPVRRVVVAGARFGCSVAVTVNVPTGVAVPAAAARALAHDPAVALP